ncbi:hypothetical protein TIFTF001_016097 [Ficus carica]|uniref:Uncharacterized protein n=1 Tax=Ficus carica TaxID=3494 RepID=A0AA88A741_FICCA|nr:hypothetical protein TIFTF001_016097 [Ficus carica]
MKTQKYPWSLLSHCPFVSLARVQQSTATETAPGSNSDMKCDHAGVEIVTFVGRRDSRTKAVATLRSPELRNLSPARATSVEEAAPLTTNGATAVATTRRTLPVTDCDEGRWERAITTTIPNGLL